MAKKGADAKGAARHKRKPYLVFLSHATADKYLATLLCERIEAAGVNAFRDDRDIGGGDSIPDTIKKTIQQSDELVVLLTPQSLTRDWVRFEIGMAFAMDCRIVPIFYHVAPEDAPAIIKDNRGFHLNDFGSYLDNLQKRVLKE